MAAVEHAGGGRPPGSPAATAHAHGRIGPNAITRVAEALEAEAGATVRAEIFARAGLSIYLREPPREMVDERDVISLHTVLRASLPAEVVRRVNRDAGARTGAYLLGNRIPRPVQILLRALPAPLAARVLVAAIGRHAWTFAGSACFHGQGRPAGFSLAGCPICRGARASEPCCDFYAATFEHRFRALVHRDARVRETACTACGDPTCQFDAVW